MPAPCQQKDCQSGTEKNVEGGTCELYNEVFLPFIFPKQLKLSVTRDFFGRQSTSFPEADPLCRRKPPDREKNFFLDLQ